MKSSYKLTEKKENKFKYVYEDFSCELPKIVKNNLLTYVKTLEGNKNSVITKYLGDGNRVGGPADGEFVLNV